MEKILSFPENEFASQASRILEDKILLNLSKQGSSLITLAGGETPKGIYKKLSQSKKIDWNKVLLIPGDERILPDNDSRKNIQMIRKNLIEPANISLNNYIDTSKISFKSKQPEIDFANAIKSHPLFKSKIDIAILGIGKDGHTASIFPPYQELQKDISLTTFTELSPTKPYSPRISLSGSFFNTSKHIFYVANKNNKENVLSEILTGNRDSLLPAAHIRGNEKTYFIFKD